MLDAMSRSFIEVVSRLACSGADDCEIKESPLLDKASFSSDELLRSDCTAYALGLGSESQKSRAYRDILSTLHATCATNNTPLSGSG